MHCHISELVDRFHALNYRTYGLFWQDSAAVRNNRCMNRLRGLSPCSLCPPYNGSKYNIGGTTGANSAHFSQDLRPVGIVNALQCAVKVAAPLEKIDRAIWSIDNVCLAVETWYITVGAKGISRFIQC